MYGTECGFLCWFNWKQVRFDSNVRSFLFWVWLQILVVLARLDPNFRFYRFYRAKWIERRFRTVLVRGSSSTWEGFHPPFETKNKTTPSKKLTLVSFIHHTHHSSSSLFFYILHPAVSLYYANMTGASKIPPHIARELRRHVKPKAKASSGASAGKNTNKKPTDNGKLYTFLGCTAFVGVTASFPFFGMAWIGPLSDRDEVRIQMFDTFTAKVFKSWIHGTDFIDIFYERNWLVHKFEEVHSIIVDHVTLAKIQIGTLRLELE